MGEAIIDFMDYTQQGDVSRVRFRSNLNRESVPKIYNALKGILADRKYRLFEFDKGVEIDTTGAGVVIEHSHSANGLGGVVAIVCSPGSQIIEILARYRISHAIYVFPERESGIEFLEKCARGGLARSA